MEGDAQGTNGAPVDDQDPGVVDQNPSPEGAGKGIGEGLEAAALTDVTGLTEECAFVADTDPSEAVADPDSLPDSVLIATDHGSANHGSDPNNADPFDVVGVDSQVVHDTDPDGSVDELPAVDSDAADDHEVDGQKVDGQKVDGNEVDGNEVDVLAVDSAVMDSRDADGREFDDDGGDGGDGGLAETFPASPVMGRSLTVDGRRSGPSRVLQEDLPLLLMLLGTLWFAITFATLVIRRHNEFGSFDYDLGIYDQGIWLLGHGRQFLTVRGLRYLGHHWNPATVIFIPFYLLGAGPNLLNASQAVALAAGAIPAYFGTKKISNNSWLGLIVAFAYLAHPSTGWLANELFHPETMAVPFVLAAWAFAEHERWRWYAGFVIAALLWKEDVALAVAFLGIAVVWRKDRKYALYTFVGALLYFLLATKLIIPQILGRSAFYEELFGPLGSTTTDLAKNAVLHPDLYMKVLREHGAETYAHSILRPYGYVSLLSPSSLLIGLPQYLVNLLSTLNFIWNPRYHYVAMPLVSATVAMSRAIASRSKAILRWGVALIVVLFSFGVRNTGVGPWSNRYDDGYWPLQRQALTPVYERALDAVPDDPNAATSSPYFLTPHLTHRYEAYTFPNPWRVSYWGVKGENARTGDRVDYVVMNESVLGPEDRATYDSVVVNSGEFTEVFRETSVVVWKRTSPPKSVGSIPAAEIPPATLVPTDPALPAAVVSTTVVSAAVTVPAAAIDSVPAAATSDSVTDTVQIDSEVPIVSGP